MSIERPSRVRPYVEIARIDHWFKNAFMLLGVGVALFMEPQLLRLAVLPVLALTFLATCLVASSNYVLNEVLDAPYDRRHPHKRQRPAARGAVRRRFALLEWLVLGALGIGLAAWVHPSLAGSAALLWVMGIAYNVPPLRTKDQPYLDVLSESVNNPIRLLLGWFTVIQDRVPPVSLIVSYWMVGAFFMAIKRFAEYRQLGDDHTAARYRRSFAHYDEDRLLSSVFFYAVAAALFGGVFIVRYQLELILGMPLLAGFLAYYMRLGLRENSPVQYPERLYRERGFVIWGVASVAIFVLLMFTHIPALYEIFKVKLSQTPPLWTIHAP